MKVCYQEMHKDIVHGLAQIATGNLSDALGKTGSMDSGIAPVFPEARMGGPAFTVRLVPGDNLAAHIALSIAPAGSVLVLDSRAFCNAGVLGEIMASAAKKRGLAGIVIDGACRDSLAIKKLNYPVFSRGLNPGGTVKESIGETNIPVSCGGVVVNPGDIVVGNADRVVVIPKARAAEVLTKARRIVANEIDVLKRIEAGETTMQIYGFDRLVAAKTS